MKQLTWNEILQSYAQKPRDVITRKNGKWFFTYTKENDVYIEPGRNHANRSKITVRRRLDKKNFEKVLDMYIRNEPRVKIRDVTQNSSYWIGIFAELLEKSQVDMEEHI